MPLPSDAASGDLEPFEQRLVEAHPGELLVWALEGTCRYDDREIREYVRAFAGLIGMR